MVACGWFLDLPINGWKHLHFFEITSWIVFGNSKSSLGMLSYCASEIWRPGTIPRFILSSPRHLRIFGWSSWRWSCRQTERWCLVSIWCTTSTVHAIFAVPSTRTPSNISWAQTAMPAVCMWWLITNYGRIKVTVTSACIGSLKTFLQRNPRFLLFIDSRSKFWSLFHLNLCLGWLVSARWWCFLRETRRYAT